MTKRNAFYFCKELIGLGIDVFQTDEGAVWEKAAVEVMNMFVSIIDLTLQKQNSQKKTVNLEAEKMNQLRKKRQEVEEYKKQLEQELQLLKLKNKNSFDRQKELENQEKLKMFCIKTTEEINQIAQYYLSEKQNFFWGGDTAEDKKNNAKLDEWFRQLIRCQILLRDAVI